LSADYTDFFFCLRFCNLREPAKSVDESTGAGPTPLTFHTDVEARLVACEWRQQMRQQSLCAELADYAGWRGLAPVVLLFDVRRCPAAFGFDLDHVITIHGAEFKFIASA
jgi:hypothetical protein